MNYRHTTLQYIKYNIGPSSDFKFWLDPWVRNRPLIWDYNAHVIGSMKSDAMAPINVFLHDRTWVLPSSNLLEVREIQGLARSTQIHSCDHVTWDGIQSNFVSYSALYNTIRCRKPAIPWFNCTRNMFTIPKCSFISWLALKDCLLNY